MLITLSRKRLNLALLLALCIGGLVALCVGINLIDTAPGFSRDAPAIVDQLYGLVLIVLGISLFVLASTTPLGSALIHKAKSHIKIVE